jgi:hypothetical protein
MLHNIIWDSIMAPLISARVKDGITGGRASIPGGFNEEEAKWIWRPARLPSL